MRRRVLSEAGARNSRADSDRIKGAIGSLFDSLTDAEKEAVLKDLRQRVRGASFRIRRKR